MSVYFGIQTLIYKRTQFLCPQTYLISQQGSFSPVKEGFFLVT